jgi:hypothetical protein
MITFDEDDAILVAATLARSRGVTVDFTVPFAVDTLEDKLHTEGLRVIAALKAKASKLGVR